MRNWNLNRRNFHKNLFVVAAALALAIVAPGCANSDSDGGAVPAATPTPDEGNDLHAVHVGSTEDGAGALTYDPPFDGEVSVLFAECLGGEGDECTGGTILYRNDAPGFNDGVEAGRAPYPLADGTSIGLEIIALSANVSVRVGDVTLDTPGDAVTLGETPDFHNHPEWQVITPAGTEHDDFHLSFKLTTSADAYADSDVYEWRLVPTEEGHGHEGDDDDDGDDGDDDDQGDDDDDDDGDDEEE